MPSALADELAALVLPQRAEPLIVPWPAPGAPCAFLTFGCLDEWRAFVRALDLDPHIPLIVRAKFHRALKLLYLAWIDIDLVKAAELIAMTVLELALTDRFGGPGRPPAFGSMLKLLVEREGLTDADIPMIVRCGGSAIGRIDGSATPSLREIRNSLAHGAPFDGFIHAGLIELARDLIEFAYRSYLAEAIARGGAIEAQA